MMSGRALEDCGICVDFRLDIVLHEICSSISI